MNAEEYMDQPSFENSLLLRRIRDALSAHRPFAGKLRVSVANELKWEKTSSGDEVLVRWACWNLELNGRDVTEPMFEVLGEHATRERLLAELPRFFPEVEVEVDDAIEV